MKLTSSYYGNDPSIANSMVSFLALLGKALENLPNDLKKEWKGFYLSYYNPKKDLMRVFKLGELPAGKEMYYLHHSSNKLTQALMSNLVRMNESKMHLSQGFFIINTKDGNFGAAVCGDNIPGEIKEAISLLWLVAKKIINEQKVSSTFVKIPEFYDQLRKEAQKLQEEFAQDNDWINFISKEMHVLSHYRH